MYCALGCRFRWLARFTCIGAAVQAVMAQHGTDALNNLLMGLGTYILDSSTLQRLPVPQRDAVVHSLNEGNPMAALHALEEAVDVRAGKSISLQDFGSLRAVTELVFMQLTLDTQQRVLLAANQSIDEGKHEWFEALASDMGGLAALLPGDRYALSAGYVALYWLMASNLRPDADGFVRQESMSSMTQAWWLGRQAVGASVERICEVGFNAGHSALAMLLSASRKATMVSFDIGSKKYTPTCADFIGRSFPGRFTLITGPSNETIPKYAMDHVTAPRCDLIFIDGGHSEKDATSDLLYMSLLAISGRTLVVMDDIGCKPSYCVGPTAAWEAFKTSGRLRELGCQAEAERRWCWGLYT